MSEDVSVDDLVKPQPDDKMTNHAEQHSLITDLIVAKDKLQQEIEARVEAGETIQQKILELIPDTNEYKYHHADMWYEVGASQGEAWWSDSTKFLINPKDLDGAEPSVSTFAPGKTIGLHFETKTGQEQVALIEFKITQSLFNEDSNYWEVFGDASEPFPGATDNIMVVNVPLPVSDDASPVYMGDEAPENPKEGGLWYDTKRLEIFIRYQEGWVTVTALGAELEETNGTIRDLKDQVAELKTQVDAGEAKQAVFASQMDDMAGHIASLRTDLEDRITVALWKFKGKNIDPNTLSSGEFCLQTEGLSGIGPLRIWMSLYDQGGNYWKTTTKLSASYASSFQVSIDEPGQSGAYNGLIKEVKLNADPADFGDWESGKKHMIDLISVYSKRGMREGELYNINLPGYLPVYMPFKRLKSTVGYEVEADIEEEMN